MTIRRESIDFKVWEPKERIIMALPFFDRVIQHMIVNIIEPIFEKRFILHSYACRKGKGAHEASDTLSKWLYELEVVQGKKIYAIKGDIHHYFQSVAHDVLKKEIRRYISDKALLKILDRIIDHNGILPQGVGIPVGNLTSQLFANVYLNKLDQYVKHVLKMKYYVRYMDDFIILSEDPEELRHVLELIEEFLRRELKLELNPKTTILAAKNGINFVGYIHFKDHKRVRKDAMRRLKKLLKAFDTGEVEKLEDFNWFNRKQVRPHETRRQLYFDRGNTGENKRNQGKEGVGLKTGQKLPPFPFIIFIKERW